MAICGAMKIKVKIEEKWEIAIHISYAVKPHLSERLNCHLF